MSEKNVGETSGSQRTDDGESVEELPTTTMYRNVRDLTPEMSRRRYLGLMASAAGVGGYVAWTSDVDGVSNGEEVMQGKNPLGVADGSDGGAPVSDPAPERTEKTPTDSRDQLGEDIVSYLEGDVAEEELKGHWVAVIWYDWMAGNKPTAETKEYMQDAFARAPVTGPDGMQGIDLRFIEGRKLPYEEETDPSRENEWFKNHIPSSIQHAVWYLAFVNDIEGGYAGKAVGNGALISDYDGDDGGIYGDVHKLTASHALHELGHIMGSLEHKQEEPGIQEGPYTVMGDMPAETPLRYWESEWEKILEETDTISQDGYHLLVR